jgi:hypothetical protein
MTRKTLNAIVDVLAFAGFVVLAATGVLMRWTLPPGSGHRTTIWGLDRHDWGAVHFWIAATLLALLAVHLLLHWRWIAAVASRGGGAEPSRLRVALGIVGLAGLIGFAVAPLMSAVERAAPPAAGDRGIRGSMTLDEVAAAEKVDATALLRALGLPPDAATDRAIGPWLREHGLTMRDLRRAVAAARGG